MEKKTFVRLILDLKTMTFHRMLAEMYKRFLPSWEIKSSTRVVFIPKHLLKDAGFKNSLTTLAALFEKELKSMKLPDATQLLLGEEVAKEAREFQNLI